MKIATIIGARPQFIKAAVVSRAISAYNQSTDAKSIPLVEVIVHTGQHYDRNMSDVFFEQMHIPQPDYFLDIHGLSHGAMTGQMLEKIEAVLIDEKPDCVLVYGDTNTTLAGALAAVKLHIPVAHVEAGLRSFNRKMPEEINRVLTDHASNLLFCPTQQAVHNLIDEGIGLGSSSAHKLVSSSEHLIPDDSSAVAMNSPTHELKSSLSYEPKSPIADQSDVSPDQPAPNQTNSLSAKGYELPPTVALVGDVMLDAALYYRKYASKPPFEVPERFILATIHRAENTDNLDRLQSIFSGFKKISQEIPIILPLHPRTQKIIKKLDLQISNPPIYIVEPVGYLEMIYLLENCITVMTDSGGLQKEAFFFHKPCITFRDETEWIELVEHGFNSITGAESEAIFKAYKDSVTAKHDFSFRLYGDGSAGEKIIDFLKSEQNKKNNFRY